MSRRGEMSPTVSAGSPQRLQEKREDLSPLHEACLYGWLADVKLVVDSGLVWINSCDSKGRQPLHMVLTFLSYPNTSACLRYLLEHEADVNATDNSGQTPLHLAAEEGFLDCVEILIKAGADPLAQDSMGLTPLDFARLQCHRKVARYLKNCMWHAHKNKEMEERQHAQVLYKDLVDKTKQMTLNKKIHAYDKVIEWANKKGLPLPKDASPKKEATSDVTQTQTLLLPSQSSSNPKGLCKPGGPHQDRTMATEQPAALSTKPWTIFTGLQPESPPREPDLRDNVTLRRDNSGKLQYTTKWDDTPHPTPELPQDVLERVLFPRAFPSRIASSQQFKPQDIMEVQHRGRPQGQSTSPWTEVAMHLPEVLEPGHY